MILLLLIPFSLLLPFSAELFPQIQNFASQLPLIEDFTAFSGFEYFAAETPVVTHQTIDYGFWIVFAYAIGVLCYLIRFLRTTYSLVKLKRTAQKVQLHHTTLYKTDVSEVF